MLNFEMIKGNNHNESIKDYFSRQTKYWKTVYKNRPEVKVSFLKKEMRIRKECVFKLIDRYANSQRIKILDIGCGSGGILESLFKRNYTAFGIDITLEMILEASKMAKKYVIERTSCLNGDAEVLPFKKNSFDVVLCIGVLQYLKSDNLLIGEIYRVIKHGGFIILTTPNIL